MSTRQAKRFVVLCPAHDDTTNKVVSLDGITQYEPMCSCGMPLTMHTVAVTRTEIPEGLKGVTVLKSDAKAWNYKQCRYQELQDINRAREAAGMRPLTQLPA